MKKSRIILLIWILGLIVYYILSEDSYLPFVMLLSTAVLFVYLGISLFLMKNKIQFRIWGEGEYQINERIQIKIEGSNQALIPLARGSFQLNLYNVYAGTMETAKMVVTMDGRRQEMMDIEYESPYCGAVKIQISDLTLYDCLGIFAVKCSLLEQQMVHIMPDMVVLHADTNSRTAANRDSDYYSDSRKGYDSSETFGIREYVPGDSVKLIHWKLSSKMDTTVIRELAFPIQNSIIIFVESAWKQNAFTPEQRNAMATLVTSISNSLCEEQMPHRICWYDSRTSYLHDMEIDDISDLHDAMFELMGNEASKSDMSIVERYLEERRECDFAHIVYVTAELDRSVLEPFVSSSTVTVFQAVTKEDEAAAFQNDLSGGMSVMTFTGERMEEEMTEIYI